jgi:hypothetical protein
MSKALGKLLKSITPPPPPPPRRKARQLANEAISIPTEAQRIHTAPTKATEGSPTFTLYNQSNKDGYIVKNVNEAKRLPGYSDAAKKAHDEARAAFIQRVRAGDRTIPEGTEVTVGDWTFTMGADNAGKSYPTLLKARYTPGAKALTPPPGPSTLKDIIGP